MAAKKGAKAQKTTKKGVSKKFAKKVAMPVVKNAFTKTQILTHIAEAVGISKAQVSQTLENLQAIISAHLKKGGPGQFTWSGVMKFKLKDVPAKKARKGVNPFTGEPTMFKAKPASKKVRILALKKLKDMVATS